MNDQNPILYEWKTTYMSEKTTSNDLRPVTLKKKDMVLVWFLSKNKNYRLKTHFWNNIAINSSK